MNVLEINDAGLLLSDGQRILIDSPGFAALDGRQLLVGAPARARSRLDPRRAHHRYWYQLEASLPTPLGAARTHADLAYAHLQSLQTLIGADPLLLAVPGSYTREQLALLLGLVQASGLNAEGLVDAAVAAAGTVSTPARVLHLDVELHRFVLTTLQGGLELARVQVEEVSKPGLSAVWDALAAAAAQAFLQQTRFDPLHTAGTEQILFDALPGWLSALSSAPSAVLELNSGSRTHRASLAREDLVQRLRDRFDLIATAIDAASRPPPASLLLSARVAAVPGLAEHLEHVTGVPTTRLDALAPARGALEQRARIVIPGAGLAHVTRLAGIAQTIASDAAIDAPTHILCGDRALPLPSANADAPLALARLGVNIGCSMRRLDGQLWLDGSTNDDALLINGRPARLPAKLTRGDRIDCRGVALRLIVVQSELRQ